MALVWLQMVPLWLRCQWLMENMAICLQSLELSRKCVSSSQCRCFAVWDYSAIKYAITVILVMDSSYSFSVVLKYAARKTDCAGMKILAIKRIRHFVLLYEIIVCHVEYCLHIYFRFVSTVYTFNKDGWNMVLRCFVGDFYYDFIQLRRIIIHHAY